MPRVRTRSPYVLGLALVGIAMLVLYASAKWRDVYEGVTLTLRPSAERALAYGSYHFNAKNPSAYDVARAEHFFKAAALIDPNAPYVFHQLARIEFLRGNFDQALTDIDLQIGMHGDSEPNSYYVRGLIEGYRGDYAAAAEDYEHFIQFDPHDWAALNDYAWVLLKAGRSADALKITTRALALAPENPWLLNSNAIALYETGSLNDAYEKAQQAVVAADTLTPSDWLTAYPGNAPEYAEQGLTTLRDSARANMHMIGAAIASSTVQ